MRILVACEESQAVCRAFRARGHEAYSCDLQPCSGGHPEWHLQMDLFIAVLHYGPWDMIIAHPPCTYLTNSAEWAYGDGPYHQKVKPETLVGAERRAAREDALQFVCKIMNLPIAKKCIENPIGQIASRIFWNGSQFEVASKKVKGIAASQIIQPWMFGDDASKSTGLWLQGLRKLRPTKIIEPRMVNGKPRYGNQTDSGQNRETPGADRGKIRSKTFPGIAAAFAEQWGIIA